MDMHEPIKIWASGPKELIDHAYEHLGKGRPFDFRIALISIDNAIELMIKTYLGLPKRIRGSECPSLKVLQDASSSFSALLDLLEKFGSAQLSGIELGDIEVYHRLRNKLYHDGTGITVDSQYVDAYLQIAIIMLDNLLGVPIRPQAAIAPTGAIGLLVVQWAVLHDKIRNLQSARLIDFQDYTPYEPILHTVDRLVTAGVLDSQFRKRVKQVNTVRNQLVHSVTAPLTEKNILDVVKALDDLISATPQ